MHTTAIGDLTEAMVTAALLRKGHVLLRPVSSNSGYDLLIDRDNVFERVQCKTGRLREGAIVFNTHSLAGGRYRKNYIGRADAFGIYCPDTGLCYLIPVALVGKRIGYLRAIPTKNKQEAKIRLASKFVI